MNCEKCGKPIPENIDFCPTCKAQESLNPIKPVENNNQVNSSEVKNEPEVVDVIIVKCQCGQKLEANWKSCPQCHAPINVEIITIENMEATPAKKENAQIYIIISLASIALGYFFNIGILFLVAMVAMVTGKINCPNSRAINVLFWLMIFFIILFVILIMWTIVVCNDSIKSCSG